MPLAFRLAAFYCAHFIQSGLFMAYFPLYLAARGFGAVEIAWVLALPSIMRTFAPAGWGVLADRTGALPALVAVSCAGTAAGFAVLPFAEGFAAVAQQAPPKSGLVRPKLRYAHQGGVNPPRIVIHGNALDRVPDSYKRYLEGYFRRQFELVGTPMAIELRTGRNPYAPKAKRGQRRAERSK